MKISLDGLLGNSATELLQRAAKDLERGRGQSIGGRAYALRELCANLTELRDRTERGDYTALDEFFAIYVVSGRDEYDRLGDRGTAAAGGKGNG